MNKNLFQVKLKLCHIFPGLHCVQVCQWRWITVALVNENSPNRGEMYNSEVTHRCTLLTIHGTSILMFSIVSLNTADQLGWKSETAMANRIQSVFKILQYSVQIYVKVIFARGGTWVHKRYFNYGQDSFILKIEKHILFDTIHWERYYQKEWDMTRNNYSS